ncbi:MAG TPA: wax ester/triacylglycerol synthase family O-acyltransferase, partial [Intrasporangiaceae bacterium]|nr:wax ester/triacylglycerol synthase family O-acyltransferase [Intrasporangiaceae bacterium]
MRRLSGLDAAFLALETPHSTGHVGGLSILDPSTASEELDLDRLITVLEPRLGLVPVMRQRLVDVPLGLDQPVWIDDEYFDIEYHVREIALPSPGSDEQLSEQIARIHARPLDRAKPLWEVYLVTGLKGGRMAIYTKVHHAAVDGVSGTELLTLFYDLTPEPRQVPFEEFVPRPAPSGLRLGREALVKLAKRPFQATKLVTDAILAVPSLASMARPYIDGLLRIRDGQQDGDIISIAPTLSPATPLNGAISPHRKYSFRTVSLDEVREIKNTFGCSVNDVVMSSCAAALRRWLQEHDGLPERPLVTMMPVSIRTENDRTGEGNKVSAMLVAIPTHLDDPLERLRETHTVTQIAKASQASIPQGLVDDVVDFAPPALTARAAKVYFGSHVFKRVPPFNVVISNVPGPSRAVYVAGARMLAHYPVSVVADGLGLNMTVIGYNGGLHFGLIAARNLVPDVDRINTWIAEEVATLLALAREEQANQAAKAAARKPGPPRPARATPRKRTGSATRAA